jgi:hypothetical protein
VGAVRPAAIAAMLMSVLRDRVIRTSSFLAWVRGSPAQTQRLALRDHAAVVVSTSGQWIASRWLSAVVRPVPFDAVTAH